jgi:glycosyltransferase involved in cell wall biosynthesis
MMGSVPIVIMSAKPLPTDTIGSWSQRYSAFLKRDASLVSHIICPKTRCKPAPHIAPFFVAETSKMTHVINKLMGRSKYYSYINALFSIIKAHPKVLIQIIDNTGLVGAVDSFLKKNGIRDKVFLQYSYHGFPILKEATPEFYKQCDEVLFLTEAAEKLHTSTLGSFLSRTAISGNGIDTCHFKPLAWDKRHQLRNEKSIKEKTIFLFCSRDVPKKGLDVLLEAWGLLSANDKIDKELWVIGSERAIVSTIEGVVSFGKLASKELPYYYQLADVFLFSTQCEEGYGLALAEALSCGCSVWASKTGGVPEVLQGVSQATLIEDFKNPAAWLAVLKKAKKREEDGQTTTISETKNIQDVEDWGLQLNTLFTASIKSIKNA